MKYNIGDILYDNPVDEFGIVIKSLCSTLAPCNCESIYWHFTDSTFGDYTGHCLDFSLHEIDLISSVFRDEI